MKLVTLVTSTFSVEDRPAVVISFMLYIYKKFLIGTRMMEKVEVNMFMQLEMLAQVAWDYPESLQQLRQVHLKTLFTDDNPSWKKTLVDNKFRDKVFKVKLSA
jgi:hypothetical protein